MKLIDHITENARFVSFVIAGVIITFLLYISNIYLPAGQLTKHPFLNFIVGCILVSIALFLSQEIIEEKIKSYRK